MKTKLQSDGIVMPRSFAAIGYAVATFDFGAFGVYMASLWRLWRISNADFLIFLKYRFGKFIIITDVHTIDLNVTDFYF